MQITFVLPHAGLAGGIRVVAIYAERLHRRGHTVTAVSIPQAPIPLRRRVRSLLTGKGWPSNAEPPSPYFDGVGFTHHTIEACRPIVDADVPDADVVVATWWQTAEWTAALSPSKGAKAYFIQHHEVHPQFPAERVRATYRLPLHKITISRWLVQTMREVYGDDEVDLVFNSVDTEQFHAPPRGKRPRPTVGLLYSHRRFKGLHVSLPAFARVRERLPDARLVAFGDAPPSNDLPLPPDAEFTLRPAQDDLRRIYAECDVWMCGSLSEGFHLPPLEAMACRCPVVSTRVGGPMDIIRDGENGYLVDVEDDRALAERALDVLTAPEDAWRAMSDAAYRTAHDYTWDDATDRFEAALQRAIERGLGTTVATPAHGESVSA